MILKTLKPKQNISLTLDKDFIHYCELNEIEDIKKLAKETFKRGFDLLKYGRIPESELTPQDKGKVLSDKPMKPPSGEGIKSYMDIINSVEEKPTIVEAIPMKSSDAKEEFTKMGVVTKKKDEKKDLYDE